MVKKTLYLHAIFEFLISSWWVVVFLLITGFIYDRAVAQLRCEELRLQNRVSELQTQTHLPQIKKQNMQSHLHAWNTPSVLEYALIHKLGLIPQNYIKVCFMPRASQDCSEHDTKR